MANTTTTKRTRTAAKSYSLKGDNNWETALNTFNFALGTTMTGVWGTGRLLTVGCEGAATLMPEKVATALVDTATQSGLYSTWGSFRAEDSTDALAEKFTDMKDGLLGAKDDATDLFIKELDNKATAKAIMKLATKDQRATLNVKLNAMDDVEYEAMLLATDAMLSGIDAKDKAALATALAAL